MGLVTYDCELKNATCQLWNFYLLFLYFKTIIDFLGKVTKRMFFS